MIPMHFNTKALSPFQGERYQYIIARNGFFLAKENAVFRAIVGLDPEADLGLVDLDELLELRDVRLPFELVYMAVEFFRAVSESRGTEAFLWVLMDPVTRELSLACPAQRCTRVSVETEDDPDVPNDLLKIGDIHSHPGKSFHSDGDIADEQHSDGIHVVVGNLDQPIPDFTTSLVVKGRRKELKPGEVLDLHFGFPKEWLGKVRSESE